MNKILKVSISLLPLMLCIDSSAYASESIVNSTGKLVVDSNTVLQVNKKLTIKKGDNESTDQNAATGTIHNHNEIIVNSSGSIKGAGQIVNYSRFETDPNAKKDSGNLAKAAYDEFSDRGIGFNSDDFKKLDRAKITGTGRSNVTVKVVARDNFKQTETQPNNSYYFGEDIAKNGGLNAVHKSDAKDEVKGSFHSLRGYTEYTSDSEVPEGATTFKHGYKDEGTPYTPVYIPKVDDSLVITKTVPEGTKLNAYETELKNELETSRKEGSFKFADWTADDPVTTYSGDNSWYNGVFKQERGAVIVPETAAMFGGRAELGKVPGEYTSAADYHNALNSDNQSTRETALAKAQEVAPTEFEWQGGPKDEYNRPDIYMNGNSSLYFNLNDKSPIFSFYGKLHGTEYDRMIIEHGEIRWKGDGSDYKGSVGIVQGSKFEVRSSDATSSSEYVGKFPNAKLYQIDDHGDLVTNPTSASTIDTEGIDNVTVNNGHMILKNDSGDKVVKMTSSNLEKGSFVELEGESVIEDVTVKGVAVAKGDVTAKNVTISGGVFAVEGSINTETADVGSTIALWGNRRADRNITIGRPGDGGRLTITDNHTLKFYADLDPASNTSDCINTQSNTIVNSGNGVQIGGINFISNPTQDSQKFNILTGAAANSTPISIGAVYGTARATFVAYQNATFTATTNTSNIPGTVGGAAIADTDVPYTFTATSGTQLATAPLNDGSGGYSIQIGGETFYIYGSDQAGPGMIMLGRTRLNISAADSFAIPVHAMHLTTMATVSQLFGLVSDDYGYRSKYQVGKFELWNKTFAGKDKFETNSSDIESIDYGTVFGLDTKPVVVGKSSSEFMGTIFGGVSRRNMETTFQTIKQKANQNTYFAGLKGTFFNNKYSLDLIASYQLAKTKARYQNYSANIKSHLFSLGTKFGYAFDLTKKFTLRPNILVDYTFAKTPNYSVSTDGTTVTRNMHRVNIVPELAVNGDFGNWKTTVFANYHKRFGSKGIYEFRGAEYRDMTKKQHMEFGLGVNRISADNNSNISLKLAQKACGVKGFKATVNVGLKF